jgi:predicted nucleotidyltransferase
MPVPQLTQAEESTLQAVSRMLRREYGATLAEVRLFGSKARGEGAPESDLDVLVLLRRPVSWREKASISDRVTEIDLENGTVTGLLIQSVEVWEHPTNRVTGLYRSVTEEGVPL